MKRKTKAAQDRAEEAPAAENEAAAKEVSDAEAAARRKLHQRYLLIVAFLIALIFVLPKLYGTGSTTAADGAQTARTASTAQKSSQTAAPSTAVPARGQPETAEPAAPDFYVGNKNSKIFHLPDCTSLPAEKNQVIFETRDEAVAEGYSPCGRCNP